MVYGFYSIDDQNQLLYFQIVQNIGRLFMIF